MPLLPRQRIACFYCGAKSQNRKGDGTQSFQCTACESTNYLDKDGNITDVPAQVVEHHQHTPPKQISVSKRQVHASSGSSSFCSRCINNQQIVHQCIANYFPSENDPKYSEFVAGFDKYKTDLEKRYPQVCPRCEAKVRERLKRNTYLAQSDTLGKRLASSRASLHGSSASWTVKDTFLWVAETVWRICLFTQVAWHITGAFGLLNLADKTAETADSRTWLSNLKYISAICTTTSTNLLWTVLVSATLVIWWNPTQTRPGRLSVSKPFFYTFQIVMLAFRWIFWIITGSNILAFKDTQVKAIHFVAGILTLFTITSTYRFVTRAPRYRIPHRNLNAPLIDPAAFVADDPEPVPQSSQTSVFQIQNLKAVDKVLPTSSDRASASAGSQSTLSARSSFLPNQQSSDDMDWEPTTPTYNFNPRVSASSPPKASSFSSSSAFSAFPPPPGPNPFYGSLPPAPKSLEARLRSEANKPAPQFRPASDAKQADWFKRMSLAQSSTGWNRKEYVHSIPRENELPDLAPGKLRLDMLNGSRNADTGLEQMFGSTFNIDDREPSPAKEELMTPAPGAKWDIRAAIALIIVLPLVAALLLRQDIDLAEVRSYWGERLLRFAYGQRLDIESPGDDMHLSAQT